jgi:hypothetical protein
LIPPHGLRGYAILARVVGMKSQPTKTRTLKVKLSGDVIGHKMFPKIRSQGKWLEQLEG